MKGYNDFNSVEEFNEFYHLRPINEAKTTQPKNDGDGDNKSDITQKAVKKERLDVHYADQNKVENIFKHIIIFTNDRDKKSNKTLKNIYEAVTAIKNMGGQTVPELHVFVAADTNLDEENGELVIYDSDGEFKITAENNTDTLVFSRLGVQGEDQCENAVKVLQDRGFLVLNPVRYAEIACNKYETAVLLKKGDIPQPNFTLMTKDILYDEQLFGDAMKEVYPEWDVKDSDKNEEFDVVCKILDGHGGTGVALIDGKRLTAWLQLVFAVDPETQLILQKKEEADGGDIRVHVLSLKDRQVILAAMKRVKIKSDFRSNVSLGAEAKPVKLSKEQEQIALRAARLSRMPWCAVDIMPLVKGSNDELGDNVVLELNASPGTEGISEVIKHNFINVLLSELTNPSEFYLQDKMAGYIETIEVDFGEGAMKFLAKLDTGNGSRASCIEVGDYTIKGKKISFSLEGKQYTFDIVDVSTPTTGTQEHKRYVIEVPSIKLGQRVCQNVRLAIVKSRNKSSNALINRDLLAKFGYIVSPYQTHLLTEQMDKVKII